jgi:O-antigen/teichoic acid export membrane protein
VSAPADPTSTETPARGRRATRNAAVQAAGELIGKLASLVLFAAVARALGPAEIGLFVFALAFCQIAALPISIGLENLMLLEVARDRSALDRLFPNLVALKLGLTVPLALLAAVASLAFDLGAEGRIIVLLLGVGVVLEALSRTAFFAFYAVERGELVAVTLVGQRVVAAGLGLGALALGFGLVAVAATYAFGAGLGLIAALVLLARTVGLPKGSIDVGGWRDILRRGWPFATQDGLGILLARADSLLIALLATSAALGRYGAAYRLLEATFFVTFSIGGSYAAMFASLDERTTPTVTESFQSALKLALVALSPCAIALAVLAEPLSRLAFGPEFAAAAEPLRFLAPVVILMSIAQISGWLSLSRRPPATVARLSGVVLAVNLALNLALIPALADSGAALAMLLTEVVAVVLLLGLALRTVGRLDWPGLLAGPFAGSAAMAAALLSVDGPLAITLSVGALAYLLVLVLVELVVSPGDLKLTARVLRRRIGQTPPP